jgi:hypothetical protein
LLEYSMNSGDAVATAKGTALPRCTIYLRQARSPRPFSLQPGRPPMP